MSTLHLVAPAYRDAATVIPIFDYDTQTLEEIRGHLLKAYEGAYGAPDSVDCEVTFIERDGEDLSSSTIKATELRRGLIAATRERSPKPAMREITSGFAERDLAAPGDEGFGVRPGGTLRCLTHRVPLVAPRCRSPVQESKPRNWSRSHRRRRDPWPDRHYSRDYKGLLLSSTFIDAVGATPRLGRTH